MLALLRPLLNFIWQPLRWFPLSWRFVVILWLLGVLGLPSWRKYGGWLGCYCLQALMTAWLWLEGWFTARLRQSGVRLPPWYFSASQLPNQLGTWAQAWQVKFSRQHFFSLSARTLLFCLLLSGGWLFIWYTQSFWANDAATTALQAQIRVWNAWEGWLQTGVWQPLPLSESVPNIKAQLQAAEETRIASLPTYTATLTPTPTLTPTLPTLTPSLTPSVTLTPSPTPNPTLGMGSIQIRAADKMPLVYIPPTTFSMGFGGAGSASGPAHLVQLDAYFIDQHEVTQAQFAAFLNAHRGHPLRTDDFTWFYSKESDVVQDRNSWVVKYHHESYPASYVSWYGAAAYCRWVGGYLPSEAQWELAARLPDERTYPWGDDFNSKNANFCDYSCDNTLSTTEYDGAVVAMPIGSYPAGNNAIGLTDLAGNIAEWVNDWYAAYAPEAQQNPTGLTTGRYRVVRGGSWRSSFAQLAAYARAWYNPAATEPDIGFRCVFPAPQPVLQATITPLVGAPTSSPSATAGASSFATNTPIPTPVPTSTLDLPRLRTDGSHTMVLVPAGEFIMGNDLGEQDERPAHTVFLDSFYIDTYEVTNEQYAVFLNAQGNQTIDDVPWYSYSVASYNSIVKEGNTWNAKSAFTNHPVNRVTWGGAQAYCTWRGGSLPSEAQWEKAARGTDSRTYPWGNSGLGCSVANVLRCQQSTTAVGSYPAGNSPYGVADLAGNVWEWVLDWYLPGYYKTSPTSNPLNSGQGTYRVLRGGAWNYAHTKFAITTDRYQSTPYSADDTVGFRCVQLP